MCKQRQTLAMQYTQGYARRNRFYESAETTAQSHEKPTAPEKESLPSLHHNSAIITLSSPIGQHVVNVVLQLAGIVAAVAFGYFAVQSVQIANRANAEAHLSTLR